jgi:hypothetical protein
MSYTGPICVEEIIEAFSELGSEATVYSVKERVIKRRGGIPSHYKSERSCKETIQRIIENHCPESANYQEDKIPYFSRTGHGQYRLLPENERVYKKRQYQKDCITKPAMKKSIAVEIMASYYASNRELFPKSISAYREDIIKLLMQGVDVADAFNRFVKN